MPQAASGHFINPTLVGKQGHNRHQKPVMLFATTTCYEIPLGATILWLTCLGCIFRYGLRKSAPGW